MRKQYDLGATIDQMLATLQEPGRAQDAQTPEEEQATIHVYPVAGGGLLFSPVPFDQEEATIIESQEPDTEIPLTKQPTTPEKEPFFFPYFLLILCFFVLFDLADSMLTAVLAPIATITITPKTQSISTTATLPLVPDGNGVPGRVLPVFTLTQSQST